MKIVKWDKMKVIPSSQADARALIWRWRAKTSDEAGFVYVFCTLVLVVLFAIGAFVIDIGYGHSTERYLQNTSDASAISALSVLGIGSNFDIVRGRVNAIAQANGLAVSGSGKEIDDPICGQWAENTFLPIICGPTANAVRVNVHRVNTTFLARVVGVSALRPTSTTTAVTTMSGGGPCVVPFGIEQRALNGRVEGDVFTVSRAAPGNWGKLNLPPSTLTWEQKMLTTSCGASIQLGSIQPHISGFSQVQQTFSTLVTPPNYRQMFVPVTTNFPNGQSGTITILQFALVSLISESGSGNNFQATFRLDAYPATPPEAGGTVILNGRSLVL